MIKGRIIFAFYLVLFFTPILVAVYRDSPPDNDDAQNQNNAVANNSDIITQHKRGYEGKTALHEAVRQNSQYDVERLIAAGLDVHAQDDNGDTALHLAVADDFHMREKLIEKLIEAGASLDIFNEKGQQPLHRAIDGDHYKINHAFKIVEILIEHGADIHTPDTRYGGTPLHWASKSNIGILKFLLKQDINIEEKDNSSNTPIFWAVENSMVHSLALLNPGADINMAHFLLLLDAGANINSVNKYGNTLLHIASIVGNTEVSQKLIDLGLDIRAKNNDGNTILHYASYGGHEKIVRLLLDLGVDSTVQNNAGETALDMGIKYSYVEVVQLLSAPVSDASKNDNITKLLYNIFQQQTGYYPIAYHYLSKETKEEIKKMIIAGADANLKINYAGDRILHWASSNGGPEMVQLLLDAGADIHAKNQSGDTAMHYALRREYNSSVINILIAAGGNTANISITSDGKNLLHLASEEGRVSDVKAQIDMGADVNVRDDYQKTPLHIAIENNHADIVKILLKAGAGNNIKVDRYGNSLLYWAVWQEDAELLKILLDAGAPINLQDNKYGLSPLHRASASGSQEMVQMLLEAGADINAEDKEGKKPAHYAQHVAIAELLGAEKPQLLMDTLNVESSSENSAHDLTTEQVIVRMAENHRRMPWHDAPKKTDKIALAKLYIGLGANINFQQAVRDSLYANWEAADGWTDGTERAFDKADSANDIKSPETSRGFYQDNDDYSDSWYYRSKLTYWLEDFVMKGYPASMLNVHRLHYAHYIKNAGVEDIEILLASKNDNGIPTSINIRDAMGRTPLHIAGEQGNKAVYDALIKMGADSSIKDYRENLAELK